MPIAEAELARIHQSQVRAQRLMLVIGLVLHPLWFWIVQQMSPGGVDSLNERLAISAVGLVAFACSYVPNWYPIASSIGWGFAYLSTAHYALLVARNPGDWAFSFASAIAIAGVSSAIGSVACMVGYASFSIGLMLAATMSSTNVKSRDCSPSP